ncbi:MAG: hypothetical protein ACKN9P_02785 [Phenylobacterium sp.]
MPTPPDPAGELGECLAIERRIDAAFEQAWAQAMARRQGACLSGFDPHRIPPRSEARLLAAARSRLAARRAWRRSPSGRLERLSGEAAALVAGLPAAAADLRGRRGRRAAGDLALAARRLSRIAASARLAIDALDTPERPE